MRRLVVVFLLAAPALLSAACAAPGPLRTVAALPASGDGDARTLLAGADAAGLDLVFVATGRTTGHVHDLEITNAGAATATWTWSGWLVLLPPPRAHTQRMLVSGSWHVELAPGAVRRIPLRGFCLDPGVAPLPAGTRAPARDALRPGRVRPLPITEDRIDTDEGTLPVLRVTGPITRDRLGAGEGRLVLLTLAGVERLEADEDAWMPGPDVRGVVHVHDAAGRRLGTVVLADPDADSVPQGGHERGNGVVALDPAEEVEIRLARAIATRAPAATAAAGVEDVEAPATTVAQHAIWRAARAWHPDAPPAEAPALPAAAERAVKTVLEQAEQEVRDDLALDFSLFDLTQKPQR